MSGVWLGHFSQPLFHTDCRVTCQWSLRVVTKSHPTRPDDVIRFPTLPLTLQYNAVETPCRVRAGNDDIRSGWLGFRNYRHRAVRRSFNDVFRQDLVGARWTNKIISKFSSVGRKCCNDYTQLRQRLALSSGWKISIFTKDLLRKTREEVSLNVEHYHYYYYLRIFTMRIRISVNNYTVYKNKWIDKWIIY